MIVLSSFLKHLQIIITNPDMLHTGVLPNHKVSSTTEYFLESVIQHSSAMNLPLLLCILYHQKINV